MGAGAMIFCRKARAVYGCWCRGVARMSDKRLVRGRRAYLHDAWWVFDPAAGARLNVLGKRLTAYPVEERSGQWAAFVLEDGALD